MTELNYTPEDADRGNANYASYHALWHLFDIGVVTDLAFASEAWDLADENCEKPDFKPTRVALIDVSVAYEHPNLMGAINTDLMIDFFSARLGTFPRPNVAPAFNLATSFLNGAAPMGINPIADLFLELVAHLPGEYVASAGPWNQPGRVLPTTSATFSAHGTAMAGLIGARPKTAPEVEFAIASRIPLNKEDGSLIPLKQKTLSAGPCLPYAGVDPYCEIVPISTSFDPDPEQLILAMLYAWLIGADVIVLARDFPDPLRSGITGRRDGNALLPEELKAIKGAYPCELSQAELALWDALHDLTLAMSQTIPIVCASGNGSDNSMIYPASMATAPGAPDDNGIIAVGARAATRNRAGYSTTSTQTAPVSVYAPSGDGERLDLAIHRMDTLDPDYRPHDHSVSYRDDLGVQYDGASDVANPVTDSTYATQSITSTDVPGLAGYNASPYPYATNKDGALFDYRSYYCDFSGTSAATAIAAGMLSLGMTSGKIVKGDGPSAKKQLRGGAAPTDDANATPALRWSVL